jgi:2-polyprenyl-3-methyl-5-hydroxy-6-metoxy-1,4-benzoquinol methylase
MSLTCPVCNDTSYPYYEYKDFFGAPTWLYKCINCGHGSHDRQYTTQQFNEIYRADYAADYLVKEKALYQKRQVQYSQDIELLLTCRKFSAVRVLDYGCSSGGYLDAMPAEWEKAGYEVNPFHIDHLRENKKHIAVFDRVDAIDRQFDLITMRGVIEHIPDHTELIAFLGSHLVPSGSVFITATPDISSVCATLYKSQWNQVVCPEHIHQFSSTSLSILLAKAGLVLRSLNHPYMDTPYANWRQDKEQFAENFRHLNQCSEAAITPKHAFAGNMISALYEKSETPA